MKTTKESLDLVVTDHIANWMRNSVRTKRGGDLVIRNTIVAIGFVVSFIMLFLPPIFLQINIVVILCIIVFINTTPADDIPISNVYRTVPLVGMLIGSVIGLLSPDLCLFRFCRRSILYLSENYDSEKVQKVIVECQDNFVVS